MALNDIINDTIDERLRDPLGLPEEFRGWVPEWVGTVGIPVPRGNVIGAYTTADTVGELGEAVHGRPCMLRVGSAAPYDFVQMTFDAVANLWVSTQTWETFGSVGNASSTSYTDVISVSNGTAYPVVIPNFPELIASGVRPQVNVYGRTGATGGTNQVFIRANLGEFASGDTTLSSCGTAGEVSSTTASALLSSGWTDLTVSPTPTEEFGMPMPQVKCATLLTPLLYSAAVTLRWVADPA